MIVLSQLCVSGCAANVLHIPTHTVGQISKKGVFLKTYKVNKVLRGRVRLMNICTEKIHWYTQIHILTLE